MRRRDFLREPIKHLDLNRIESIGELVESFRHTSFQSRNLARCLDVYRNMLESRTRVTIFLGLSGAMTPAGMRKIIRDMIERNFVDVVVSTGANLYHDVAEAFSPAHFLGSSLADDAKLKKLEIDRIYDTFGDEKKFKALDPFFAEFLDSLEPRAYSSRELLELLGRTLNDKNSMLHTAARHRMPVFCPALNDSSIGINLTEHYVRRRKEGKPYVTIDPIRDNYEIAQIKRNSAKTGVIFIGGGTPKNYIQQIEITLEILGYLSRKRRGHDYALQITTDDPKWGGLSGCTFDEAQSWGKIKKNATKAVAYLDATIGMPLLVGAVMQTCKKRRKRLKFEWEGDKLKSMKVRSS